MNREAMINEFARNVQRAEIGIHLDGHDYECGSISDISYADRKHEIGYLKINPERVPVVLGSGRTDHELSKIGEHLHEIHFDEVNEYSIFVDDRCCEFEEDCVRIYGNAYIARRQGKTYVGLTGIEIKFAVTILAGLQVYKEISDCDLRETNYIPVPNK